MVHSDHVQSISVVNGQEAVFDNGVLAMLGSHTPFERRTWPTSHHPAGIFGMQSCASQTGEKTFGKRKTDAIWSWTSDFALLCAQPFAHLLYRDTGIAFF
jgi:hypothetical protein